MGNGVMGSGWKGRGEAWGVGDGDGVRRGVGWKGGDGGLQRDEVEQWEWDDDRGMGGSNGNGVKREEWGSPMGWGVGQ